jgi:hypothetical protein
MMETKKEYFKNEKKFLFLIPVDMSDGAER